MFKGLEGGVGYGEGRENPPMAVSQQLAWKHWNCVRYWVCVSLFALMQKCKSKYRSQGAKGHVPLAVPMAKQVVLGRLLDPPEPQFSLQTFFVSSVSCSEKLWIASVQSVQGLV